MFVTVALLPLPSRVGPELVTFGTSDLTPSREPLQLDLISRPAKGEKASRVTLKTENAEREVPLPPALLAHLWEYRASTLRKANSDYVFSTASGGPVAWNYVDKSLKGIVKRAGLREPWPTFHDLRHTFASLLIAA